ncbi:MAG: hypothetical protein AAGB22_02825 [Bacteroidota bacterium]
MPQNPKEEFTFDSTNLIFFLLKYRKPLLIVSFVAAIASAVVAMIITPKFLSSVVFYPASTSSISKSLLTEDPSGKQDLVQFGEEEQAEQMLQILKSDYIRNKIVEKYNLWEHYEIESDDPYKNTSLIEEWESNVSFKRTEFESVRVDVLDTDSAIAAAIANDIASLLDTVRNRMQQERAKVGLAIIEKEYFEMKAYMNEINDSLQKIGQYGVIEYESQSEMLAQTYFKALSSGNSRAIARLEKEKAILAKYGSAYLSLKENLEAEQLQLALLRAKYEEIKADAHEELTHKFIVNHAYPSEKKAYPIRWLIVVVSTLSAFLLTILAIITLENVQRFRNYQKQEAA